MNRRRPPIPTARTVADAMRILAELTGRVAELIDETVRVRLALEALAGANVVDAPPPGREPPASPEGEQPAPNDVNHGPIWLPWDDGGVPELARAFVARAVLGSFHFSSGVPLAVTVPNDRGILAKPGAIVVEERAGLVHRLRVAAHQEDLAGRIDTCLGIALLVVEEGQLPRVIDWVVDVNELRALATTASRARQAAEAEARKAAAT